MVDPSEATVESALAALPQPLRSRVRDYWTDFRDHAGPLPPEAGDAQDLFASLPRVWAASEFVARTCLARPSLFHDLAGSGELFRRYVSRDFADRVGAAAGGAVDPAGLKVALRAVRLREMLRIAWRDLAGWAPLAEVMSELTGLADACLEAALSRLFAWSVERMGRPVAEDGSAASMVVLGMGKLGGEELNFSSDIDLIFAYTADGEVAGQLPLSNSEFFSRLGRSLIDVLGELTVGGRVFRVDMRLRPHGSSGPLALSFDSMEQYYQAHGREWERYALIKARQVAGDRTAGGELLDRLRPFVYRRYLDYGAFDAIRSLKVLIEQELLRKGIEQNIKLGPGGIREVEFIGQAFQLVRGGREAALRQRPIREILAILGRRGDLTPEAAKDLDAAYEFLRRTENRLQMAEDRQTHVLPQDAVEQLRLSVSMGFGDWVDFHAELSRHMARVHGYFEQVFIAPQVGSVPEGVGLAGVWLETVDGVTAVQQLMQAGFRDAPSILDILRGLRQSRQYDELSAEGRERLDRLMPLLLGAAALSADPEATLTRLVTLIEAIARRSVYFSLLVENPMALSQLAKLCAASAWIAGWISQHPILLDELIDPASLYSPLAPAPMRAELRARLSACPAEDLEEQMNILREFHHGHVLRVAAADVGAGLADAQVSAQLAEIADCVLAEALALAQANLIERHGRPACRTAEMTSHPGFSVIAYGKLGSREIGYGSDLDMVFLYDGCQGEAVTDGARVVANEVFFTRLGQRLIHIITTRTAAGILYQMDMRLRPSGGSGLLATNLDAFRRYQLTEAWTWEHQALIRARPAAGSEQLGRTFEAVRKEVLCLQREPDRLRQDIVEMRARMRTARLGQPGPLFDLKQDPGGMIDIEFMVQYWVLWRAHEFPELTGYRDNIHLLEALSGAGLIGADEAAVLAAAYRRYLSVEHQLRLQERQALVAASELGDFPEQVVRAWRANMEAVPRAR
ncbi:MAG: bifunctional [glutamate--ammonia ligase]-adenylyl-L-tyrosine phosphorylase/[glutamate--ammonia-ligase] adenylyltransferase [Gammaproteobacteria bacterium]|nr:bifunctional [glutamate--ammonia ligase]-adenylyl-L-tyrosine phosphorylase/[glutamate--ammonia-ligase] adenylyltransferase [Gammaproteobacteria bacterium]